MFAKNYPMGAFHKDPWFLAVLKVPPHSEAIVRNQMKKKLLTPAIVGLGAAIAAIAQVNWG